MQTQGPFTAQIKNTNKQHQIDKIFQYRAKRKKTEGGRVEEKYKIHQAVVEDRSRH